MQVCVSVLVLYFTHTVHDDCCKTCGRLLRCKQWSLTLVTAIEVQTLRSVLSNVVQYHHTSSLLKVFSCSQHLAFSEHLVSGKHCPLYTHTKLDQLKFFFFSFCRLNCNFFFFFVVLICRLLFLNFRGTFYNFNSHWLACLLAHFSLQSLTYVASQGLLSSHPRIALRSSEIISSEILTGAAASGIGFWAAVNGM